MTIKPVGAGLLANAVFQSPDTFLMDRIRGQARSYNVVVLQTLPEIPYLRSRWAIAVWDVCKRAASWRVDG